MGDCVSVAESAMNLIQYIHLCLKIKTVVHYGIEAIYLTDF